MKKMKLAYFAHPLPYGLYTVFRHLRLGFEKHGYEVRWVGVTPEALEAAADPRWASEMAYGEVVPREGRTEAEHGRRVYEHLLSAGYDGLFLNVKQTELEMNMARYMPPSFLRIMIVHAMATGTYIAASALRDYVHATVGISPRVSNDLIKDYRFPSDTTICIPNAIDLTPYENLARTTSDEFRLVYLGRLDAVPKGVLYLPEIMAKVKSARVRLTVVGDGNDGPELKRLSARLGDRIRFAGVAAPETVPKLLQNFDALILPSQNEGFGLVLVEAMAAGCIPISSQFRDATDFVVKHGETGYVFPVADAAAAAELIDSLANDPAKCAKFSAAARKDAFERFGAVQMAKSYYELLEKVRANPRKLAEPLAIENWKYPSQLSGGFFRRVLPKPIKEALRRFTFRA